MKKVYIKTFGCQMNEHDTVKMLLILAGEGYLETGSMEEADLMLFNTCTIREKAHHKAISEIGRAVQLKGLRSDITIGVCGCVAQQEGAGLRKRYPMIDIIFGPDRILALPELLMRVRSGGTADALDLIDDRSNYRFMDKVPAEGCAPISAFVLAMKGCNCSCSYCIVPSVRGREISRPADEIVEEVGALARAGSREVTLLGQNVSAYRSGDGRRGEGLAGLIRRIAGETEIERIRFTSPHPLFINDELIGEFADNEKLCPHIHLPVQAGSDKVLKSMKRGYTRDLFIERASKLRESRSGMSITTDLIVGFPGESGRDFEDTLNMMRRVGFDSAFAFKYSPRPGTWAAEGMCDDVPTDAKERRLSELLALQRSMSRDRNEALVGTIGDVLAVGTDRMRKGFITGRRADNRIVHFAGNPSIIGDIVPVRINGANDNSLNGELCHDGEEVQRS
jgi:tRNA-2-methylthio-N6-dimethylallyladenosine synthase